MLGYVLAAIIAYCIGSISFSVIFTKKFAGFDVREKGIAKAAKKESRIAADGLCDILKGVVAIALAILIGKIAKDLNSAILVQIAALAVVIGHTFPVFFGFKGGKGVATSLGIILLVNWRIGLICLVFALTLMILSRMVSLGSIMTAILFPIMTIFITDSYIVEGNYILFGFLLGLFVIYNHRTNLKRIFAGEENKLSFGKKDKAEDKKEEKEMNTIMALETTISEAKQIENIHNLIKNKGINYELSEEEKKLINILK